MLRLRLLWVYGLLLDSSPMARLHCNSLKRLVLPWVLLEFLRPLLDKLFLPTLRTCL